MFLKIVLALSAGVISGLFSAGGGLILLPALTHLFKLDEKVARGTTIFCILPMVLTTGIFYFNNNYLDWNMSIKCAIGGIIGAYIGVKILKKIPDAFLRVSYILFLVYVASRFLIE